MPVQQWIKVRLRRLVPMVAALGLLLGGAVTFSVVTATTASADSSSEITGAVNWAVAQLNSTTWDGLCLEFVYDAYLDGANVNIGDTGENMTAYQWWQDHGSAQVTDGSTPPEGALVFWGPDPWSSAGHVALSLGGGTVISSEERSYTGVHEFTIAARNNDGYAQYYLGWLMPPGISAPSGGGSTPTATAARPAPVQYGGEMDVYVIGGDGYLYKDTWTTGWSGFSKLSGGNLVGSPMAMVYTNGSYSEMDVFAVGSDGTVSKDTWNGHTWGFGNLGKPSNTNLVGNPTAMEWTNGSYQELDVYATGADGNVYKDTWNGSTWSTFTPLGTGNSFVSSPTVIQYGSEMDVYVRASNNVIYKDTWTTTWSGWNPLGTMTMQHEPFAMVYTNGSYSEMDIYSIATSANQPEKDTWNGSTWSNWNGLTGGSLGSPYAMEYTEGSYQEMDVYLRGANNVIYHDAWNGQTWTGWGNLGTSGFASEPSAVEFTNGSYQEMDVFATTSGGAVYKDTWNGQTWSGWNPLP